MIDHGNNAEENAPFQNEVSGYISHVHIETYMHRRSCPLVCICGPSSFNHAMRELLVSAGGHDCPNESVFVW